MKNVYHILWIVFVIMILSVSTRYFSFIRGNVHKSVQADEEVNTAVKKKAKPVFPS